MNLANRIALPMVSIAILLIGVIGGLFADSWKLTAVTSAAAVVVIGLWAVFRMRVASRALREVRTELRHIRAENQRALSHLATFQSTTLASEGDINQVQGNISALSSLVTGFVKRQEELIAEINRIPRRDELETLSGKLIDEQRARFEAMAEDQADSKALVAKTKQQMNRSVRRQSETYGLLELLEGKLTARADYLVDEVQRELRKSRGQIAALSVRIGQSAEREIDTAAIAAPDAGEFNLQRYLYYLSYQIPREIEAMDQMVKSLQPVSRVPLLGGWAISPTGTLDIVNVITRQRPETVVECGSGTSTLWMAMAVRDNGCGHIYSLEHDPAFADETRAFLAEHRLSEYVTVIDAPIVEHDDSVSSVEWYDIREIRDLDRVDLLVIDGPPEALGSLRGGAMTLLSDRLSDGAHVFLDDVNRRAEKQLVQRWLNYYPQLQSQKSSTPVQAHLLWTSTEQE